MKNLKIKVISKYLRPYKKEFLYGALALLLVNILSVVIPLEVKNIIDQLQNGFSSDFIISKSLWLIFLATCMGLIRLFSRQIVFGIGRKVEVNLRQKLFDQIFFVFEKRSFLVIFQKFKIFSISFLISISPVKLL